MLLKVGQTAVAGVWLLLLGGLGVFFCNATALHPVGSCTALPIAGRRVTHTLNVPTHPFQAALHSSVLSQVAEALMLVCPVAKQSILQARKGHKQSQDGAVSQEALLSIAL